MSITGVDYSTPWLCHQASALAHRSVFAILNLPLRFCLEPAMLLHPDVCAEVVKLADTPS